MPVYHPSQITAPSFQTIHFGCRNMKIASRKEFWNFCCPPQVLYTGQKSKGSHSKDFARRSRQMTIRVLCIILVVAQNPMIQNAAASLLRRSRGRLFWGKLCQPAIVWVFASCGPLEEGPAQSSTPSFPLGEDTAQRSKNQPQFCSCCPILNREGSCKFLDLAPYLEFHQ